MFNALAAAKDFAERGDEVTVQFQGAGTRWAGVLSDEGHPDHGLYHVVRPSIVGASDTRATFFGARDGVTVAGPLCVSENDIPGVGGRPSLARLSADGFSVLTL